MSAAKKKKRAPIQSAEPLPGEVLVLRTCDAKLRSRGGFQWPAEGPVEATDWNDQPVCGYGLHGLKWGQGDGSLVSFDPEAKWLVCAVVESAIVDLVGKVKFPRARVLFVGDRFAATAWLAERSPTKDGIVGGTATAGYRGTATAGVGGTATAGYRGTATAGYRGTATAGYRGTATAGYRGTISIRWWDEKCQRYRLAVADVGENGIEPNVAYSLREGKFIKAVKP